MSGRYVPAGRLGRAVHSFEENTIAILLGLMTLVTFVNVLFRYVFNSAFGHWLERVTGVDFPGSLIWGLEVTLVLFAWLVLFGIAYGFKITAHLGVDALLNAVSPGPRRVMILISAGICIIYAALLMKGAWDYWAPFGGFQATEGRWFPLGFNESTRDQAWYETEQIPMPEWLRFIEPIFNMGEEYEKIPRFIPYAALPVCCALILFRVIQATIGIATGRRAGLIVSHEAEDAVEDVAAMNRED